MKTHKSNQAKILILGESNSVFREGWVYGFTQNLQSQFIVDNRSIGSTGVFNALFQLNRLGDDLAQYSHIVIDSSIQDATFYQNKTRSYFDIIGLLLQYLRQYAITVHFIQFEPCQQSRSEQIFYAKLGDFYRARHLHYLRANDILGLRNSGDPNNKLAAQYSDNQHLKQALAYQIGVALANSIKTSTSHESAPSLSAKVSHINDYFHFLDTDYVTRHTSQQAELTYGEISTTIIRASTMRIGTSRLSIEIDAQLIGHEIIGILVNAPSCNGLLEVCSANTVLKNFSNSTKTVWGENLVWGRCFHTPVRLGSALHLCVKAQGAMIEETEYCPQSAFDPTAPLGVEILGLIVKAPSASTMPIFKTLSTLVAGKLSLDSKQTIAKLFSDAQWDDVIQIASEIVTELPNEDFVWKVLGAALMQKSQYPAAVDAMRRALAIAPNDPEIHNNLAATLQIQGELQAAEAHFHKAISLKENYFEALFNLGDFYFQQERHAEAEQYLALAYTIRPEYEEARNKYAISLHQRKKFNAAKQLFEEAVKAHPDSLQAHINLANAFRSLKQLSDAEQHFRLALAIKPDSVEALSNLSHLLSECGRYQEAEQLSGLALRSDPQHLGALNNRALALRGLNRLTEAEQCLRRLLENHPDSEDAKINLAYILFSLGKFEQAWPLHEARFHPKNSQAVFKQIPQLQQRWQGESLQGKNLLIWPEQGIGDQIQFIRYLDILKSLGPKHIFVYCIKALEHCFSTFAAPDVSIISQTQDVPSHDLWVPLLSLPLLCQTTSSNVPAHVPYLQANPALTAQFQEQLKSCNRFKIGICWSGSSSYKYDHERSINLASFKALTALDQVQFFNLQPHSRLAFLQEFGEQAYDLGHEIDADTAAFEETAALINNLDLIITCDTSVGHLAGALGKPVWLLLAHVADWRWMTMRDDSIWYPYTRLFRQDETRSWEPVFERLVSALRTRLDDKPYQNQFGMSYTSAVDAAQHIQTPISFGEFFDKLSILKLKHRRISDQKKRKNIDHELQTLRALEHTCTANVQALHELRLQLDKVNERIWDVEDEIRVCEKRQDFGEHFIELARAVYINNDLRASLKNQINVLTKSGLIEEKSHSS